MKRKVLVMGLAMVTGLPQAVCARSGGEASVAPGRFWNAAYMPHYGTEGATRPLMDHISVGSALPKRGEGNAWRLELTPPAAVSTADDRPLMANDRRLGFTLKLDF